MKISRKSWHYRYLSQFPWLIGNPVYETDVGRVGYVEVLAIALLMFPVLELLVLFEHIAQHEEKHKVEFTN